MNDSIYNFIRMLSHQLFVEWLFLNIMVIAVIIVGVRFRKKRGLNHRGSTVPGQIAYFVSVSAASVITLFTLAAFLHVGCARERSSQTTCMSNLKAVALAVLIYANDNDETFSPASKWVSSIKKYDRHSAELIFCPATNPKMYYGFNSDLGGVKLESVSEPTKTIMLFEGRKNVPSVGGINDVDSLRHTGASNVCFTDGHVKRTNASLLKDKIWIPKK